MQRCFKVESLYLRALCHMSWTEVDLKSCRTNTHTLKASPTTAFRVLGRTPRGRNYVCFTEVVPLKGDTYSASSVWANHLRFSNVLICVVKWVSVRVHGGSWLPFIRETHTVVSVWATNREINECITSFVGHSCCIVHSTDHNQWASTFSSLQKKKIN